MVIGDFLGAHALKVIVALVVFAYMIEAKSMKLPFAVPAFGCAVIASLPAAWPFASRGFGLGRSIPLGFDPQLVEIFWIGFHGTRLCCGDRFGTSFRSRQFWAILID